VYLHLVEETVHVPFTLSQAYPLVLSAFSSRNFWAKARLGIETYWRV
jgi:hypothetical protein